jgi:uncharacterized protein (DUF427 family)
MSKSPGHQKSPEHQVRERRVGQRMTVTIGDEVVADSNDVIRVDEDKSPPRHYFPRADVTLSRFAPTDTTSECPFKGKASYFTLNLPGTPLKDVAWTYEHPYDEHRALQGRIAFWEEKIPGVRIQTA